MLTSLSGARWLAPACLLAATAAAAQDQKAPDKTVEALTVTAGRPVVQTSIDRRSYDVARDLQAQTGSLADALRNLPSVEVDLQGNLSLRGDPNVTILVDGKPAAQFSGAGRADALQQLSADQIARVEVITNPSADMTPEGSGGVINLITKSSRGAGLTGGAYGAFGSMSNGKAGGSLGHNSGKLSLTATAGATYQNGKAGFTSTRTRLNGGVAGLATRDDLIIRFLTRTQTGSLKAGYALDPKMQVSAEAQYNLMHVHGRPRERFTDLGPPGEAFDHSGRGLFERNDLNLSAGLHRSFAGEGHSLSIDLTRNRTAPRGHSTYVDAQIVPFRPPEFTDLLSNFNQRQTELKVAYARPLPGEATLKAGYELKSLDHEYEEFFARGPAPTRLILDPGVSYRFRFDQTIHTLYATYERPVGDVTIQAGLRAEQVRIDIRLPASGRLEENDYRKAYPTLHLAWRIDDQRQATASYSQRVTRPSPFSLNPFRSYVSVRDSQEGDPHLKPQVTRAFEAAYQRRHGSTFYLATAYLRRNADETTTVIRDLGDGTFVLFPANLGSSRNLGVELSANGKLGTAVSYSLSANLADSRITARNLGFVEARRVRGISGKASLDWQATPDDLVQINVNLAGRRPAPQGYLRPGAGVNLGWRHKLSPRASLTATVQDVLATQKFLAVLESDTFRDRRLFDSVSRTFSLRLDYRFGGAAARTQPEPKIEYDGGASPP